MAVTERYVELFSATSIYPPHLDWLAGALVICGFSALLAWIGNKKGGTLLIIAFAIGLFIAGYLALIVVPYNQLRDAVLKNTCSEVEGPVSNFIPELLDRKGSEESFVVNNVKFEYGKYHISAGYNNIVADGAVNISGRYVKICHVDGVIGRLSVKH